MLLLSPPSRRGNDVGITLRAPAGCQTTARTMADLAIGSSCPERVAERVRSCILHSGRYDCRVTPAAALFLARSPDLFDAFGGSIEITDKFGS